MRDVVHFEVGEWSHLHTIDGAFAMVPGKRCAMCPPERTEPAAVVTAVNQAAGTFTVEAKR